MDYSTYQLSVKEMGIVVLQAIGVTAIVSILFYRSFWGIVIFPIFICLLYRKAKKDGAERQKRMLQEQFVNGIRVLNSSLQAGLAMENAWREVQKETKLMYGEDAVFYQELQEINHSVALNIPIEKLFLEFAYRAQIEDIIQFAEILDYGKRSGGNWKKIIDSTVYRISERYDAQKQIEVMVAEKKMEQQIMNMIPLGILGFLQMSAWDYMSVMFHNLFGVLCMTVFFIGYLAAILLSQKVLKVKV